MNKISSYIGILFILGVSGPLLYAQSDTSAFTRTLARYKIRTAIGFQFWTTYSTGMEVYRAEAQQYEAAEDRLNTQLRRTRLTIKGEPFENLSFNLTAAIDLVGRDLLAATEAGANNGSSPGFRLWNAFVQWRILPGREQLFMVAGYQIPQIGRESITAALRSTSFEKAWSQNYIRRHLTGIGPGRTMGVNFAGQWSNGANNRHLEYHLGVFNPVFEAFDGNSTGLHSAPLLVGRAVLHIGDPESKQFSMSHKINYFGKRKGISLGLAAARQGRTDLFRENGAIGGDILFNYGPVNVDGEYYQLFRRSADTELAAPARGHSNTGYARISYNLNLPRKMVLEPVATYWFFRGAMSAPDQEQARRMRCFNGADYSLDLGGNLYWNPDFKLSLHYTWRWGDAGTGQEEVTFNNYFNQPGLGAVRRGNFLGLGLVLVI